MFLNALSKPICLGPEMTAVLGKVMFATTLKLYGHWLALMA